MKADAIQRLTPSAPTAMGEEHREMPREDRPESRRGKRSKMRVQTSPSSASSVTAIEETAPGRLRPPPRSKKKVLALS